MLCLNVLVTVVMEAVVAAQRSQGTQPDGIGEENLGAGINPHLPQREVTFQNLFIYVSWMSYFLVTTLLQTNVHRYFSVGLCKRYTCASPSLDQSGFRQYTIPSKAPGRVTPWAKRTTRTRQGNRAVKYTTQRKMEKRAMKYTSRYSGINFQDIFEGGEVKFECYVSELT